MGLFDSVPESSEISNFQENSITNEKEKHVYVTIGKFVTRKINPDTETFVSVKVFIFELKSNNSMKIKQQKQI
jgi:hypothetical protein